MLTNLPKKAFDDRPGQSHAWGFCRGLPLFDHLVVCRPDAEHPRSAPGSAGSSQIAGAQRKYHFVTAAGWQPDEGQARVRVFECAPIVPNLDH